MSAHTDPAPFFIGAREGREDAAPVSGPRHARTGTDVVDNVMTALAVVSVAVFAAFLAGIFAGWWLV